MANYIIGSVGQAEGFVGGNRVLNSKTILNESLSFSVSPTEIRGGEGNALIGTIFFDSNLAMSLEDATFSLEYLALKTGSTISAGSSDWATEEVVTTVANQITVVGDPIDFGGFGKVGFYRVVGGNGEEKQIEFIGKTATVADLPMGTKVCVKYNKSLANAREIKIASNFVPSELYLLVHAPLFKAGSTTAESNKVGEIAIEIPRFLIDPSGDLSLTSNGVATVPLNGNAQVSYDTATSCDNTGFYGRIKEIVFNADLLDDASAIVVADSDIDLVEGDTQTLKVMAIFNGMTAPKVLDNASLTFASATQSVATVAQGTGVVEALSAGESVIDVVVTDHPELVAKAVVTVTSA